ncbi:MAG: cell division protein FtsW [Candidatus Nealsonbacteria bacterium]|nr:cell division protein FtsW [Candidatus Nealsonbacteria bacterium]
MKTFKKPDSILLVASLTLVLLGVLILASVSAVFSIERFGKPDYLLNHQLLYGLAPGLFLGLIAFLIPLEKIKKISPWIFVFNLFFLVLLISSRLGLNLVGASRWIGLGPVNFQPSEFLKISLILYLAAWLTRPESSSAAPKVAKKPWDKLSPGLPFLFILGLVTLLLAPQPDVGTLSVVASIALVVFFLSGTPWWQNASLWLLGAAALAFLIKIAPYRLNRWLVFLNPDLDPMGRGYQLKQALIAIGSGGFLGLGLGLSRQKFGFLPQTIGDAIFPVFAEEAGFLGALILISVLLIFVWQGFRVSRLNKDKFSQLVGAGLSFWIGFQALTNISSLAGLLPLTGVPLPFVSYGGSHLVAELIGVGILLNISRET